MRESTIIFLPLEEDDIRAVIRRPDTKANQRPRSEMMTMKMLMYDEERRHMIVQQLVILNDMNRQERIYANMNFYCDSNMFIDIMFIFIFVVLFYKIFNTKEFL